MCGLHLAPERHQNSVFLASRPGKVALTWCNYNKLKIARIRDFSGEKAVITW
jgi:hypothetical protein